MKRHDRFAVQTFLYPRIPDAANKEPKLWNISYDDILSAEVPDDAFLVG